MCQLTRQFYKVYIKSKQFNLIKEIKMKYEMKLDFPNSELMNDVINKSYYINGDRGKIGIDRESIKILPTNELYNTLKGLNNNIVKLSSDCVDGVIRFLVKESEVDVIELTPVSLFCIKDDQSSKYTFY